MVVGVLIADLLLGDVHSLKAKRAVLRPLLAALRRFDVSAGQTGLQELHRRAQLSVALVAPDQAHARQVLDRCERLLADNPETTLLSTRQRIVTDEDLL